MTWQASTILTPEIEEYISYPLCGSNVKTKPWRYSDGKEHHESETHYTKLEVLMETFTAFIPA